MLPSDMNLKIRSGTVGGTIIKFLYLMKVNSLVIEEPVIPVPKDHPSHKVVAKQTQAKKPTHEDEKIALVLFLTSGFVIWNFFR